MFLSMTLNPKQSESGELFRRRDNPLQKGGKIMLKIRIETRNSAFEENLEEAIEYCLDNVLEKINDGYKDCPIHDSNGNNVGNFKLTNR